MWRAALPQPSRSRSRSRSSLRLPACALDQLRAPPPAPRHLLSKATGSKESLPDCILLGLQSRKQSYNCYHYVSRWTDAAETAKGFCGVCPIRVVTLNIWFCLAASLPRWGSLGLDPCRVASVLAHSRPAEALQEEAAMPGSQPPTPGRQRTCSPAARCSVSLGLRLPAAPGNAELQ